MGSYLSIVNNTQDTWHCRLSADESVLKFFKVIVGVLGATAASLDRVGSGSKGATAITNAAGKLTGVAVAAGSATEFASNLIRNMNDKLVGSDYFAIEPGQSHRWGKMTLSLWQQGTCVRSHTLDDGLTIRTKTLDMRPIFSGSLAGSNRDHHIQRWIDRKGVEITDVVGEPAVHGNENVARALTQSDDLNEDLLGNSFPQANSSAASEAPSVIVFRVVTP